MPEATTPLIFSGLFINISVPTTSFSAKPPCMVVVITLSPTTKFFTPSPTSSTIPATSPPGEKGRSGLN